MVLAGSEVVVGRCSNFLCYFRWNLSDCDLDQSLLDSQGFHLRKAENLGYDDFDVCFCSFCLFYFSCSFYFCCVVSFQFLLLEVQMEQETRPLFLMAPEKWVVFLFLQYPDLQSLSQYLRHLWDWHFQPMFLLL